jgi:hypothetical protein
MRANFEFDLPEEKELFDIHCNATRLHYIVDEFEDYLRVKIKYPTDSQTEGETKAFSEARQMLLGLLNE